MCVDVCGRVWTCVGSLFGCLGCRHKQPHASYDARATVSCIQQNLQDATDSQSETCEMGWNDNRWSKAVHKALILVSQLITNVMYSTQPNPLLVNTQQLSKEEHNSNAFFN